eukprot:GHUV01008580.1.p1 GENE.GHUV01008580.1~~GHUV01008580.1.p1  ORF type:complete len:544 (+),score=136.06 GHUV01008580.1:826-2457(+)
MSMCQLGGLAGTTNQRLALHRPAAWAIEPAASRHRSRLSCSAQLQPQSQHFQQLQHSQQLLYSSLARHQCSLGSQTLHPCCPWPAAAGRQQHSSRPYSRTRRHKRYAAAHAAGYESSDVDAPVVVSTVDKQRESSSSQQHVPAGSDADFIQQPPSKAMYSPLHYDVLEFVRQVVPTAAERAEKQRIIQCVASATKQSFAGNPNVRVQPFGSFVNGLSTWNSDVDLVVTGLAKPSRITGGFSHNDKRLVYRALDRIASALRRHKKVSIRRMIIIRTARIPIIKLETNSNVVADISLGDSSGPKAANYVAQQVGAYPPLAPLVLVLKVYLRSCGLNEVANGGISSFSLTNMVLAHLMDELRDGHDIFDLGETLYGFLLRFGDEFDVRREAVSVSLGGCVQRSELHHLDTDAERERLLLEDPLTGRDVASGSYRIVAVQMAFSKAARRLENLAQQRNTKKINYLEGLFDVRRALDRSVDGKSKGAWGGQGKGGPDEYFVIGQGNRFVDYMVEEDQIEYPLEGDDYGDRLEGYLDGEDDSTRRRKRR